MSQSKSDEQFHDKKVGITEPKCERALLKPSPTKAVGEILGIEKNFQSLKMTQGLKDENTILEMCQKTVGCHVEMAGFTISRTHGLLGA